VTNPNTTSDKTRKDKVGVKDVARLAGVSIATVSRVLNQPELVRPEIREKVLQRIAEVGYTPDSAGRALRSGKTRTIGAIVPTLGVSVFAQGVEAMQNRLGEHGYTLLIASSQYDPNKELQEVGTLIERGVDGVVLVGDSHLPEVYEQLRRHDMPFVTTYICRTQAGVPAIGIDNDSAAYDMARYLLGLGHREFGVIANLQVSNDRTLARLKGIERALGEAGIELPESRLIRADHSLGQGRRGLRQLLQASSAITAVICTTDTLAIGALAEAKALGLGVPQALSITGFDDIELSSQLDPSLTTISISATEMGHAAADHLVAVGKGVPIPLSVQLPYRLIVRNSTAKVRSANGTAVSTKLAARLAAST
jgi:LacI family transcriptional regulator